MEFVRFADYVNEWKVSFTVLLPPTADTYSDSGKLIKGVQPPAEDRTGIILPLSNNELRKADNGTYTEYDRKIYVNSPLLMGTKIVYQGETYEIDRALPQNAYTDVCRYYAKGKGAARA